MPNSGPSLFEATNRTYVNAPFSNMFYLLDLTLLAVIRVLTVVKPKRIFNSAGKVNLFTSAINLVL